MLTFLQNKFDLTPEQTKKVQSWKFQFDEQYLSQFWVENPQLTFEQLSSFLQAQETILERAENFDLSNMKRYDSSMTDTEVIAKFMNISIKEAQTITLQHPQI